MREHTSALEAAKGKGLFRGEPGKDKEVDRAIYGETEDGRDVVCYLVVFQRAE